MTSLNPPIENFYESDFLIRVGHLSGEGLLAFAKSNFIDGYVCEWLERVAARMVYNGFTRLNDVPDGEIAAITECVPPAGWSGERSRV